MSLNLDPIRIIGIMLGFIIGVTIHEFMHAYTAVRLGDNLPLREGRVTLNPAAHFDPFGFFMFILLALGLPAFAWGRPVMVNPGALRGGRRGMMMVAAAGPLSNLVLAGVLAIPFRLGSAGAFPLVVQQILFYMIFVQFTMFVFNLIPIPPLDGFTVLTGVVSNQWALILEPLRRYGFALILGLVFLPGYLHIDLIGRVINPFYDLLNTVFLGGSVGS